MNGIKNELTKHLLLDLLVIINVEGDTTVVTIIEIRVAKMLLRKNKINNTFDRIFDY